jgi:hypothetical protein
METVMETERRTHALGLVHPPAGPGHDYTGMQLTFIGIIAEYAARHDYERCSYCRCCGWPAPA